MSTSPFGFQRVKVIAFGVDDSDRAHEFYERTLGLPAAYEGSEQVGYLLGETILMLKANWYASPTKEPNPRITIAARGMSAVRPTDRTRAARTRCPDL